MTDVNYLAIFVAAVAAFMAAFAYYAALGEQLKQVGGAGTDRDRPPGWVVPFELAKHLVLAVVVGGLAASIGIEHGRSGMLFGIALWIGFPVVLLASSVVHENVPWKLAAIHAGDWLGKLLIIAVIVGVWR